MEIWESIKDEYDLKNMQSTEMNTTPIAPVYPEVKQQVPTTTVPTVSATITPYPSGRKRATKACICCKQRHTRCGFERPCHRCKSLGFQCVDPPSKKRGSKKAENTLKMDRGIQKNTKWRFKDYSEIQKIQMPIPMPKREFIVLPQNDISIQYPQQTMDSVGQYQQPQYVQVFTQQEVPEEHQYQYFQQEPDVYTSTNPLPINWVNYSTLNDA